MSSLNDVVNENLPETLVDAIVRALNVTSTDLRFAALLDLGEVALEHLRNLALSEYLSTCRADDGRYHHVRSISEALVKQPALGHSLQLLQQCLATLCERNSSVPFGSKVVLLGDHVEDIAPFCEMWDAIKQLWIDKESESESVKDYASVIGNLSGRKPYNLDEFLGAMVNCRNAWAHKNSWTIRPGVVRKLTLNDNFYTTVNARLAPALAKYLEYLAPVLARYLPCKVLEVKMAGPGWVASVEPPRRPKVHVQIRILHPEVTEASLWFVDMESLQFCFPSRRPEDVQALEGPMASASPPPALAGPVDDRDASSRIDKLQFAVEKGIFTPVLGPGCYRVQSNMSRGRAHVEERAGRLRQAFDESSHERDYIDSVVRSRLGEGATPVRLRTEVAAPLPFEETSLLALQVALVQLGVRLTRSFAEAMGKRVEAITELFDFSVKVEAAVWKSAVAQRLEQAFKAAEMLSFDVQNQSKSLGLGAAGIRDRLRDLRTIPAQQAPTVTVPLTLLEWIGDLVWHTLRFRAPMYPAPDDLAFQLSVCLTEDLSSPRKRSVGAAASPFQKGALASLLELWLKTWAPSDGHGSSAFHEAIARALVQALPRDEDALFPGNSSSAKVSQSQTFASIALDTTFEEGLQRVFRKRGVPYYVAFPAKMVYNDLRLGVDNKKQQCWILYSDLNARREWVYLASDKQATGRKQLQTLASARFEGPLVVKLNGAPLTPLPMPDDLQGVPDNMQVTNLQHRVIVSYADVMRAVGTEAVLPPGLHGLLKQKKEGRQRSLCLLGFPLTDSNSRLRVYDLHRGESAPQDSDDDLKPPFSIFFVDSPKDPVNHAFLNVQKDLIEKTLDEVATLIDETENLAKLPRPLTGDAR